MRSQTANQEMKMHARGTSKRNEATKQSTKEPKNSTSLTQSASSWRWFLNH